MLCVGMSNTWPSFAILLMFNGVSIKKCILLTTLMQEIKMELLQYSMIQKKAFLSAKFMLISHWRHKKPIYSICESWEEKWSGLMEYIVCQLHLERGGSKAGM